MPTPRFCRPAAVLLASLVVAALVGPVCAADKVEVKVAKLKDVEAALAGLKGKVVVIDFWADT